MSQSLDYDSSSSVDDFDWKSGPARKRFGISWARRRRSTKDDVSKKRGPKGLSVLHRPPEPLIDIVFVHGLRGGSVKTWQKGGDPQRFWPQLWLPVEPGFEHANIHSFGYDADIKTGNDFNIHDFGRDLLEEMRISPFLTDNEAVCGVACLSQVRYKADCEQRPIIMLGHSMGGLVIKKVNASPAWLHSPQSLRLTSRTR